MLISDSGTLDIELSVDTVAFGADLEKLARDLDKGWVWVLSVINTLCSSECTGREFAYGRYLVDVEEWP